MRTACALNRSACAFLLALLLALRAIGATGYMPALAHDSVTIVACPDADVSAPLALGEAHHHHGKAKHNHSQCPYASASSSGALEEDFAPLLDVLILAAALLLCRTFLFVERQRSRERPPTRAPPIPA